jgi:hypothetical protein
MERTIDTESFMSKTTPSSGEGARWDQTPLLGRELTPIENRLYSILCDFDSPVPTRKLYEQLYGIVSNERTMSVTISTLMKRVRLKLGEESVITRHKIGYLPRRSSIK